MYEKLLFFSLLLASGSKSVEEFSAGLHPTQRSSCEPDACVANYVRGKVEELKHHAIESGLDPFEIARNITTTEKNEVSHLTTNFWGISVTGLFANFNPGMVTSTALYGYLTLSSSYPLFVHGSYNANGTALGSSISASGDFYTGFEITTYENMIYQVNEDGLIFNITTSPDFTYATYLYKPSHYFENLLPSTDPLLPILVEGQGRRMFGLIEEDLKKLNSMLQDALVSALSGSNFEEIISWSGEDTLPPISTVTPITTTPMPIYPCHPSECRVKFVEDWFSMMPSFGLAHGIGPLPLNKTWSKESKTEMMDISIEFRDLVVGNLFSQIAPCNPSSDCDNIEVDLNRGTIYFEALTPNLRLKGSYAGNGTLMGVTLAEAGEWSGSFDLLLNCRICYRIDESGRLIINEFCGYFDLRNVKSVSNFESDVLSHEHLFKASLESWMEKAISENIREWVRELNPTLSGFMQAGFGNTSFLEIITGEPVTEVTFAPDFTTPEPIPTSTFAPKFNCAPDKCIVMYIMENWDRFPDWFVGKDIIIFPGTQLIDFTPTNVWKASMNVSDATINDYFQSVISPQTSFVSDCLNGSILATVLSPFLNFSGKYSFSGKLADHAFALDGDWNTLVRVKSTLSFSYKIDGNGNIASVESFVETNRYNIYQEDFEIVDPSLPLAYQLNVEALWRAPDFISVQIGNVAEHIEEFLQILLRQKSFLEVVSWNRFGNETARPPVMCPELKSPENGLMNVENYLVYSIAEFRCNEGYHLNGRYYITCLQNGTWSSSSPSCLPNTSETTTESNSDSTGSSSETITNSTDTSTSTSSKTTGQPNETTDESTHEATTNISTFLENQLSCILVTIVAVFLGTNI